jgi:hypothetical protein
MPKVIEFPKTDPQWVASRASVLFFAIVDGSVARCFLSIEAMWDHFGVRSQSETETKQAFLNNRTVIEQAARRKIEAAEDSRNSEFVLRPDDFPRQSATPAPARPKFLTTRESPAIRSDPVLLSHIDQANSKLENYVRTGMSVAAEWDMIAESSEPIIQLVLKDDDTGATVSSLFTRSDLNKLAAEWYPLSELWDNLLDASYDRLSKAYEANAALAE